MKAQVGDTPENLHNINRQSHSSPFYVVQAHWLTSSAFHLLYYYSFYYYYYYWKPDLEMLTLSRAASPVLLRNVSQAPRGQACKKRFSTFHPLKWWEFGPQIVQEPEP